MAVFSGPPLGAPSVAQAPWQRLNFFPDPHQHGSLRPSLGPARCSAFAAPLPDPLPVAVAVAAPPAAAEPRRSLIARAEAAGRGWRTTVQREEVCVRSGRPVA